MDCICISNSPLLGKYVGWMFILFHQVHVATESRDNERQYVILLCVQWGVYDRFFQCLSYVQKISVGYVHVCFGWGGGAGAMQGGIASFCADSAREIAFELA